MEAAAAAAEAAAWAMETAWATETARVEVVTGTATEVATELTVAAMREARAPLEGC